MPGKARRNRSPLTQPLSVSPRGCCKLRLALTALEPSSDQFPGSRTNSMGTTSNLCLPTFMILASKAPLPPCIIFISYPVSASPQDTVPTNANTLTTTRTASSNLQLSTLLTETYTENEALKKKLTNTRKHAEKAERLLQTLTDASSSSPSSESSAKCVIIEYEDRVQRAEIARDEAESRRRAVLENWTQLDRWLQFFINHDNIPQSTHAKLRKQIHPPTIKTIPREWRTEDVLFRLESSCPPAITTNRTHTPSLRHIHISIAINNTIPIMRFRVDPIQGLQVALAALHWTLMRCSLKPLQPTPSTASLRINDHNNHRIWRVFLYQLQPHLKMGPRICRATTHEDTPRRGSSSRRVHVYEGQQAQEGLGPINAPIVAPPAQVFPATNAQGQRICRQCGFPRRYKDNKCIEKWGPGPMGPRTVCDQCFRHLRNLTISASLPFIQSFVANISTDQLDTFVCLSPPEPGFDMKLLVEDFVSRWSSSLRCFGLRLTPEDAEAEELPLDTLKPLFPLHNLCTLSLRG
ncbi:uncharacterized protein LACBIDRAFT_328022 [Laccaria bicolor S238N-H82]|uniref:Predicted protein n=1 Tax=Laccaria bicolor (strain S238N-H82 / ATCC MYA-4686) TaxID=486041 RepID=B0DE76_LACBS|nr:uncharacterized protein LACBIDRAFT_328022 [Laccaria bicolor S238N-H82]EDR07090.1 predicted protein [Laccaria bicolor S238N-H82]|eukprot:XP_001882021.1 predicted protein [Laccaria bicolor S238N-H82]